jgi:hypothetical protein
MSCPHDVAPDLAIAALLAHEGPVLLDLDETLYLGNSTEDFIDSARPGLVALLLMRLLDLVRPWRWTGGDSTRDVWRVRCVAIVLPGTTRAWRRRVGGLAARFGNVPLLAAIHTRSAPPIVATNGFHPIVAPLVAALGLGHARIVSARASSFADRRDGKLRLAVDALGAEIVRDALVLTDSVQDLGLLDACARPLRTEWPDARFRPALGGVYFPGRYTTKVKRPGSRYIVRGILQEDFAFWVLSSVGLAALPVLHVLGLIFLLVSFWSIYEIGYVDNDLIAARFEEEPQLSAAFPAAPAATPRWAPWAWALASGGVAVGLLRWPAPPDATDLAIWAGVLLATHGWFALYNRVDKATRVWLFPGLQFARSAAFVALVPVGPVGAAALGAHVLARWVPYFVYRSGSRTWPDTPFHLIRLLFFVVLSVFLAIGGGFGLVWSGTGLALLGWNVYRARQEITAAWRGARRLDRPGH